MTIETLAIEAAKSYMSNLDEITKSRLIQKQAEYMQLFTQAYQVAVTEITKAMTPEVKNENSPFAR